MSDQPNNRLQLTCQRVTPSFAFAKTAPLWRAAEPRRAMSPGETKLDENKLKLMENARQWLKNLSGLGVDEALKHSDELLFELHGLLGESTEARKTIGPLIRQIKGMQNKLRNIEPVCWVGIHGGRISIGHRPSTKLIADLRLQGGSHILTLLSESEGARDIEKHTRREGLCWLWFAMRSASPPDEDRIPELKSLFADISTALVNRASVYIHCSAGIHRTGMITYGFLRYIDLSSGEAKIRLKELRDTTSEEVGEDRLSWGDRFGTTGNI